MKIPSITQMVRAGIAAQVLALLACVGCSKKAEPPPAPATATTAPATETPPADAAAQAPTGPALDSSQMVGDPKAAIAAADAALKQREYEKAVRTMLAVQQAQLNEQQAALAHQQMINLQRNLAGAIANGDPNAIAAGELLRAAHQH